jgi:hypothetical protein
MSNASTNRSGRDHVGTGSRAPARSHNPLADHELIGTIRWLDAELERLVLDVQHADGRAGAFLGRDVTVDLEAARVHGTTVDALLPGVRVRVKARLPRDLGATPPEMVAAHAVHVLAER